MKKILHVENSTRVAKLDRQCYHCSLKGNQMAEDKTTNVPFIEGLPYKLAETARISELMARSYYKNYVKGVKSILELDEFRILSHIISNPDLSQSDISKLVYKGKAHVGKILTDMEQKGFITRILTTHNNMMVKQTALTEYGEKLYSETDEAFKQLAENVLADFTPDEIQEFLTLLDKFKSKMLENNDINF